MLTVFSRDTGHATRLTGPADREILHRAVWIDLQQFGILNGLATRCGAISGFHILA